MLYFDDFLSFSLSFSLLFHNFIRVSISFDISANFVCDSCSRVDSFDCCDNNGVSCVTVLVGGAGVAGTAGGGVALGCCELLKFCVSVLTLSAAFVFISGVFSLTGLVGFSF